MAAWVATSSRATFAEFSSEFLRIFPGKPPQVTRLTWKALSMTKQGSYHAFLTEFNRQKAMISTGEDEVVEHFLLGLTPALRAQVEFYKNRCWKGTEYQALVDVTTERVNSSVIQKTTEHSASVPKSIPGSSTVATTNAFMPSAGQQKQTSYGRGRGRGDAGRGRGRSQPSANPGFTSQHAQPRSTAHVGRTPQESSAINAYCRAHNLCKFCRLASHRSMECRRQNDPPSFVFPPGWDETFWANKARENQTSKRGAK